MLLGLSVVIMFVNNCVCRVGLVNWMKIVVIMLKCLWLKF